MNKVKQLPTDYKPHIVKRSFFDPSLFTLLLANAVTIWLAVTQQWDLGTIIIIYWLQSVIIGIFNVKRIKSLAHFNISNIEINGKTATDPAQVKQIFSLFFVMHYGIFHFTYLIFILIFYVSKETDFGAIILTSIIFLINHFISHRYNLESDQKELRHIARVMFQPYARILPMHLIIVLGTFLSGSIGIVFFMTLKTFADLISHMVEHAPWSRKQIV